MRSVWSSALAVAALGASIGCQSGLTDTRQLPDLDRPFFDCRVQPVLTKYCSALACHGNGQRFFTVFSRNRLRLDTAEDRRSAFMAADERAFNYDAARALVIPGDPDRSLLARKPLDIAAGGAFHVGATLYSGGDVFTTTDDPDYQVLVSWINGNAEDPACEEPGSNL